jgi:DNA-binding XRE family transcriptional regulator
MDKDIIRIKVVLAEKERTNKWLAVQLGCAPTTVSKWCTNVCQPPMETYLRIAKLQEIEIDELLNKKYVESL